MSVYIKNMKMPRSCHFCVAGFGGFCFLAPSEEDGRCPDNERPGWCPLIELPPHGDLIDKDEIGMNYIHIRDDGMKIYTQRAIDNAPTIIPAEEEGET